MCVHVGVHVYAAPDILCRQEVRLSLHSDNDDIVIIRFYCATTN